MTVDERQVSDPRAIRALAHPVRLELLQLLRREGPLTASQASELLGESPGNMSWHLQTLAKYGFVEEAVPGKGRARPWRAVSVTFSFSSENGDGEQAAAAEELEAALMQRHFANIRAWWARRTAYSKDWVEAAFSTHSTLYLTAQELQDVADAFQKVLLPYRGRGETSARPQGALAVEVVSFGQPLAGATLPRPGRKGKAGPGSNGARST